jgi:hypothetical protein
LQELIGKWDGLKSERKGELMGHVIGKYGIEIFAGKGLAKAMRVFRDLKRANNLMTYEAMAISKRNQALLKADAAKRVKTRKEILKTANLTVQADKQGAGRQPRNSWIPRDCQFQRTYRLLC